MFRSLFGCGVVCGLVVKPDGSAARTRSPSARPGARLLAAIRSTCRRTQRIVVDEDCDRRSRDDQLWVVLCGTAKCCAPAHADVPVATTTRWTSMCTRERDGFEIRVVADRPNAPARASDEDEKANGGNGDTRGKRRRGERRDEESKCRCADPTSATRSTTPGMRLRLRRLRLARVLQLHHPGAC